MTTGTNIADLKFAYFGGGIDAEYAFYAEGVAAGGSAGNPWYVGANTGEDMIRLSVTGEATFRWMVQANGEIQWGNGTDAADTTLYRAGAAFLKTDSVFASTAYITSAQDLAGQTRIGAIGPALEAAIVFGNAGDSANLYRSAADTLKTDDSLVVNGNLSVGGSLQMDARNITTDTSTGTKIGTAATQKFGFFGADPVVRPSGVAVDAAGIHAALVTLGLIAA